MLLGFLLALPLGILAVQVPRAYPPILAVTTSPLRPALPGGLRLPPWVTGLTDNTVILPLAAYALAILVRSVTDGLNNVPD